VTHLAKRLAVLLAVLLIPLALSISPTSVVRAATMTGTFTWNWTYAGGKVLSNGTRVYYAKDTFVYQGVFSGNSTANDTEYGHPDESGTMAMFETFTGSFNGSQQGSEIFQGVGYYEGYGEPNYLAISFSGGTGGLAGLKGTLTRASPEGGDCTSTGSACTFHGKYTVTAATWGNNPVPEFSDITLPIIVMFTTAVSLTMLRRRKK